MDAYRDNGDRPVEIDGAPYIWLRYSTQFTTGGRTHTIEMGIPVPLGASAEQREQLIREAEAGMEQLSRRVESRVSQMLQRNPRPPEATRPQEPARSNTGYPQTGTRPTPPAPPAAPPRQSQTPQSQQQPPQQQPQQAASQTPAREAPQAIPLQEKRLAPQITQTTQATEPTQTTQPARTSIGAEMPVTPNLSSSASGNIKLGEFIQIIRKNWGLSPKEAMDLLHLGNLSNMNYRDLLRQLEPLVEQRTENTPAQKSLASQSRPVSAPAPSPSPQAQRATSPAATQRDARPATPPEQPLKASAAAKPAQPAQQVASTNRAQSSPFGSSGTPGTPAMPTPSTSSTPPAHSPLPGPPNIPVYPMRGNPVREAPRVYKFDEEEEEREEREEREEVDRESGSDPVGSQNGMSDALARIKIDELKEKSGSSSAVSQGRLTVLHNLLDSQISETQFQQMIQGIWNTTSDKKLKQDQVEALISWAKEDYFVDEVEVVLAVLSEE